MENNRFAQSWRALGLHGRWAFSRVRPLDVRPAVTRGLPFCRVLATSQARTVPSCNRIHVNNASYDLGKVLTVFCSQNRRIRHRTANLDDAVLCRQTSMIWSLRVPTLT